MINFYGMTDTGMVRTANQDTFKCFGLFDSVGVGIVCDGMGGVNGGNIASDIAAELISDKIKSELAENFDEEQIRKLLSDAVNEANYRVFAASQRDLKLSGMGTTCVIAVVKNNKAHIINLGDSRAYLVKNDGVVKITKDHSIVQELVDSGKISDDEAKSHPQKNIITRALGTEKQIVFDYYSIDFKNEIILLCSDGLSNYLKDNEIKEIIDGQNDLDRACKCLIDAANEKGGSDNITVVILKDSTAE